MYRESSQINYDTILIEWSDIISLYPNDCFISQYYAFDEVSREITDSSKEEFNWKISTTKKTFYFKILWYRRCYYKLFLSPSLLTPQNVKVLCLQDLCGQNVGKCPQMYCEKMNWGRTMWAANDVFIWHSACIHSPLAFDLKVSISSHH